jgi:glucose-1-phosphate adenylyltransferase
VRDVRAALLAGGKGERMGRLTDHTCKPMVPYAGSCRLVDFSVANAVRSGVAQMVVMSHHCERDLIDHLLRCWDGRGGLRVHIGPHDCLRQAGRGGGLPPGLTLPPRAEEHGTADALLANAEWVFAPGASHVLVLHADHVYCFDYRPMLDDHRRAGADATIGVQRIERRFVHLFGMVDVDPGNRVRRLVEKPADPTSDLVFTAFCLFRAGVLREVLTAGEWRHDISHDVLPFMIAQGLRVRAFPVSGYWADIGTVERYHLGHLDLVRPPPALALSQVPWTLPGARPVHVSGAQVVSGQPPPPRAHVRESVLFPGCVVEPGAWIERSVVLPGARVSAGARVRDTIVLEAERLAESRSGLASLT